LDYRQVGWLGTLEDFAAVDAVKGLGRSRSTRAGTLHQPTPAHAIAIIAAAITSAAAADLPEISLMGTLLLWDEDGIAFGNLTFWNRPLLGTATAIVVDCQFLDRDGHKVDQRKLTAEEPVYGRTIKTVRVRIGTLSEAAETMACSVVDFKWVSWQH
jgi:hypothetical protein